MHPASRTRPAVPAAVLDRILHQDDAVIVLDKPAGLPVHRGPRGGASLEDWLPALQQGKRHLPQPAHRLDTDTAGCLALGRTKPALAALGALFAGKRAEKTYWAVLRGVPEAAEGVIDAPLRKISSAARGWRMEVHPDGQNAVTRWQVLGTGEGLAWVALTPETGRTHQLRVHCAQRGWPILGDPLYGAAADSGLHLLARSLTLPLVPPVMATAPVPEAMRAVMRRCGWAAEG
ncbi:RNA pseudouridine synthase [Roseomonas hellenica]|uniref:RNA pseudouridine synthase n=1 Tax=Plastoroseomonas hellenica TaxID=2687306 RepID=A0ABS5F3M6_9PROT|nr:RNA pseudouridine synthase [Plastoroseomonas hellenica]MBR0667150.1 RNA pseudouridine synthase [Plastoroseomonas hellenica]